MKKCEKVRKSANNYETILPFSCCPLVFLWEFSEWMPGSELMVIWKGRFETAPCRATLATPFPALCPRILGTRFTNYCLRMFWGELMVIWKQWFETVPCRATLNTPFSALCPRILGTRCTNYGLRVSGMREISRKRWILNSGKSKWGLSKWGLKVLVRNCPRLPTNVVILWRKFPLQKATKAHNCARLCTNCREWP